MLPSPQGPSSICLLLRASAAQPQLCVLSYYLWHWGCDAQSQWIQCFSDTHVIQAAGVSPWWWVSGPRQPSVKRVGRWVRIDSGRGYVGSVDCCVEAKQGIEELQGERGQHSSSAQTCTHAQLAQLQPLHRQPRTNIHKRMHRQLLHKICMDGWMDGWMFSIYVRMCVCVQYMSMHTHACEGGVAEPCTFKEYTVLRYQLETWVNSHWHSDCDVTGS